MAFFRADQEHLAQMREHEIIAHIKALPQTVQHDLLSVVSRLPVRGRPAFQALNPERLRENHLPTEFSRLTRKDVNEVSISHNKSVYVPGMFILLLAGGVHCNPWMQSAEGKDMQMLSFGLLLGASLHIYGRLSSVNAQLKALVAFLPEPVVQRRHQTENIPMRFWQTLEGPNAQRVRDVHRERQERAIVAHIKKLPFIMRRIDLPGVVDLVDLGSTPIFTTLDEEDFTQQGLPRKFACLTKEQIFFVLRTVISRKEREKRDWMPLYMLALFAVSFSIVTAKREYVSPEQQWVLPMCALVAYAYWYMTKKEEGLPESILHFKAVVEEVVGEFEGLRLPRAEGGVLDGIYAVGQAAFASHGM